MNKLILGLLVIIGAAQANAQPINLQAGSSITINGDYVTCQPGTRSASRPQCSIRIDPNNSDLYDIYAGSTMATYVQSFSAATDAVKQMKSAGLCD